MCFLLQTAESVITGKERKQSQKRRTDSFLHEATEWPLLSTEWSLLSSKGVGGEWMDQGKMRYNEA